MCTGTHAAHGTSTPHHSGHIGHASHHAGASAVGNPPPLNADQAEWMDYASSVGEENGIPGSVVLGMIKNKGAANFSGNIMSSDGTGERLYGPMLLHGGLLEGGVFAGPGGHGLYGEDGQPLIASDLEGNPAAGIRAGVMHLKQLVEMYNGDLQKAINHYETGDPDNSEHPLGKLAEECGEGGQADCSDGAGDQHGHGHHGTGSSHSDHGSHGDHGAGSSHGHHSSPGTAAQPIPYSGTATGPLTGDIDPGTGSSHPNDHVGGPDHGHGFLMNADAHNAALSTMFGKPASEAISYLVSALDAMGGYNKGQNEQQKLKGAYLAANLLMKYHMTPPTLFANETEAGLFYGQAKILAMNNDAEGLRSWVESKGGNAFGLGDAELLNVWGVNEHNNLHAILFGNRELANAVHMTSLNDNDGHEKDGINPGKSGGYNNKGEYPQWGWFEGLQKVGGWFSGLKPAGETQAA